PGRDLRRRSVVRGEGSPPRLHPRRPAQFHNKSRETGSGRGAGHASRRSPRTPARTAAETGAKTACRGDVRWGDPVVTLDPLPSSSEASLLLGGSFVRTFH